MRIMRTWTRLTLFSDWQRVAIHSSRMRVFPCSSYIQSLRLLLWKHFSAVKVELLKISRLSHLLHSIFSSGGSSVWHLRFVASPLFPKHLLLLYGKNVICRHHQWVMD